ncbi:MAG: hypothetical protein JWP19_2058 [Rhodoglobus sp.]|nr:hypothetical protein [Rhodoglobus sp.]
MMVDTWFGAEDARTLGFLHVPDDGVARGGVVICPPLGYDHALGYRGMRYFAQQLEAAGVAAIRFDYLGEGDASGATASPNSQERWLTTIENAVAYLHESGVERVVVLGLRSGALLAVRAMDRLRDVAALVLWDPDLSGRRFVRRQRSLYELTVGATPQSADDAVALISLTLHSSTAAWVEGLEVTAGGLSSVGVETLVLGRRADDASAASRRIAQSDAAGVDYRVIDGQEEWLEAPGALAILPQDSIRTIIQWVGERLPVAGGPVLPAITAETLVGTSADGVPIVERIRRVGPNELFAIETVLGDQPTEEERGMIVLQPGAAEHRVGPGRFQVDAARELAAQGFRAIRFDRRITGDSTEVRPGEPSLVFAEEWVDDADDLIAGLATDSPLVLAGLCAGGWVSARVTERHTARLTVLMSPNYFKTTSLKPGGYTRLTETHRDHTPLIDRVKGALREHVPGWLWRMLAGLQLFHDPAVLLEAPSRNRRSTVAILLTPEDVENFAGHRGPDAVARLRVHGADIRVTTYPFGDHSLFGEEVRAAMRRDLLALAESTVPQVAGPALAERRPA